MSKAKKTALGGILAAFALILLFLANLSNVLDICLVVIASMVMFVGVIELGRKWMLIMYAAVTLLALLLVPIRAPLIMFALFLGYYPFVKSLTEQLKQRSAEYVIKFAVFNAAAVICMVFFKTLFFENVTLTNMMAIIFVIIANGLFLLYDIAMTRLITMYMYRIRPKLFRR
ncbi:MAG: hypothetical protein IIZ19_09280 [Clostridia bacterium]|nr:hypothetical protein [Clostridia bacterium]